MAQTMYNTNFLETPDPVTGLQRRTGQNFLDHKQTIHERITLEHVMDPSTPSPQNTHGIHRPGSAITYVTALGASLPTTRPTGENKAGTLIPAIPLDANDAGRLCWHEGSTLYVWTWTSGVGKWIKVDTTPVGSIILWPSTIAPDSYYWAKCSGGGLVAADYPALAAILGSSGGSITLPDMQGISTVGAGTQANFNGTDRTKGSGQLPGTKVEDQIQSLTGTVGLRTTYNGYSMVLGSDGIFKAGNLGGSSDSVDRVTQNNSGRGFTIDLTAAGVRHGEEARASAYVVDYYIKKR